MIKRTLCALLLWLSHSYAFQPLNYRSQGEAAERELVGITHYINKAVDYCYGVFTSNLIYTRSFQPNRIADRLFEDDLRSPTLSAINITGSGVSHRNKTEDWLADYFGLPRDFNSTIKFEPEIINYALDLYWYVGNPIKRGFYITVHAPLVSTHWDLHFFEAVNKEGIADQPPGYFNHIATGDDVGVRRSDLLDNFTDFVFHAETPNLGDLVTFCPLTNSLMVPEEFRCNKTKTALCDIQFVMGYNFTLERWCHAGIGLRIVAPTGTKPQQQFIFEPLVGDGRHWQLGAQWWNHYTFYVSENEETQWMIYTLANITHLFNAKQCRTFDLTCKVNSRWMLAEQMGTNNNLLAAILPDDIDPDNVVTPIAQFANKFSPVANLTQRNVKISYNVQIDAVVMFSYLHKHFNLDFGYNIWYRSRANITKGDCTNTPLTTGLWALKGDSYVFGFTSDVNPLVDANIPIALSATQSKATIHSGTNNFISVDGDLGGIDGVRPTRNPGIDNPYFAAATVNGNITTVNDRTTAFGGEQTHTSFEPIFITEHDLDMCTQHTEGLSNKLFVQFSYIGLERPYYTSVGYIGSGLQLELGTRQYAVCQWGVWLKGGVYFN